MSRVVRVFPVLLALPLLAASPATSPARRTQIETWLGRLVDRDADKRDAARIELMDLPATDLWLLRACVATKRPAPAQAAVVRDVVVHVLTREAVRSMPSSGLPYIGVQLGPLEDPVPFDSTGEPILPGGTLVLEILPGAPAAAKLQVGDVILGLDVRGGETAWITQPAQLGEWVRACPRGDAQTFVVRRAGRQLRLTITPEPRPLPLGGMIEDALTLAENAKMDANRVFDQDWATLPGLSP